MVRMRKQTITWQFIVVLAVSCLTFAACNPLNGREAMRAKGIPQRGDTMDTGKMGGAEQAPGVRRPWSTLRNWAYWLDNPNLEQLGASNFELLVIDYSADGSAARAFSAEQITMLRQTDPRRRVVAYLSIGQAEAYRGYWQSGWHQGSPTWLDTEDPDWPENYWVRYWDPAWQNVIYRYLDAILAAGFDGIYLDRVDAYQEPYAAGHERAMVQFVAALARYSRIRSSLKEDFGIIVQNAEELAGDYPDYQRLVTGIGREEVYVQATNIPTSQVVRARAERYLDLFRQNSRGRLVLTVDYATQTDLICEAFQRARARGYVPYVAPVGLDHLQLHEPPSCST